MKIISTENLKFNKNITYPDISIEKYQPTFITGPSGCGKTTFFKFLNKTEKAESGEIFYKGKNLKEIPPLEIRKDIVLGGQEPFLFEGSIKDNFNIYHNYRGVLPPDNNEISRLLNMALLDISYDTECSVLSGGQKQRIFTVILLSFCPEVILLDEPSSALDQYSAEIFIKNILNFSEKNSITPVIISHSQDIINKFSKNTVVLGGKL